MEVTITFIEINRLKINSAGVRLVGISDQQSLFSICEPSRHWARAPIGSCTDSTKWGRGCQSWNSTRNFDHWWWKNSWGSKDKLDLSLLPERISGNDLSTSIKGVYKFVIIYSSPVLYDHYLQIYISACSIELNDCKHRAANAVKIKTGASLKIVIQWMKWCISLLTTPIRL